MLTRVCTFKRLHLVVAVGVVAVSFALVSQWTSAADTPRDSSRWTKEPSTQLGIKGRVFTRNGEPTFLFGISYYAGLGASEETIRKDLADIEKHGLNWIRVWATWAAFGSDVSAVDAEGKPREEFLKRLRWLVAECDRRGVIVDVTLSRGNGVSGPHRLQSLEAHRRAVETIVTALKDYRNWYLDLANERNVKDKRFTSFADLKELRERVRTLDSDRLVTASHAGDISKDDLREYLKTVQVDFITPHRPRKADSPMQTEAQSKEYLAWMKDLGREVPLHYQEPFRRDFGPWQPQAEDFAADLKGARAGGAAGWCFHNGDNRPAKDGRPRRSFDLREKRLFEQLDQEEAKALPLVTEQNRKPAPAEPAAKLPERFEWQIATPESQGMSKAKLDALKDSLAAKKTKAFLVIRNDRIVYEWYAEGHGPTKKHYTASLAKAIGGGLSLGIAITDCKASLDDRAAKFVPQWKSDPKKSAITLRQLGSHTSGLEDAEADGLPHDKLAGWKGDFWKRLDAPNDPFTIARDKTPLLFEPGQRFQYSNPGIAMLTYCVTASLRRAPHQDIRSLLRDCRQSMTKSSLAFHPVHGHVHVETRKGFQTHFPMLTEALVPTQI